MRHSVRISPHGKRIDLHRDVLDGRPTGIRSPVWVEEDQGNQGTPRPSVLYPVAGREQELKKWKQRFARFFLAFWLG